MNETTTRRRALVAISVGMSPFTGCINAPGHRSLTITQLTVSEANGTYRIEFVPRVGGPNEDPFRNVSAVVLSSEGEVLCQHSLGTLSISDELEPVNFTCNDFPQTITYQIERDPCAQNTTVNKRVYNEEIDSWNEVRLSCEGTEM